MPQGSKITTPCDHHHIMCTLSICQSLLTRDERRWQRRGLIHKHASQPAIKTLTHTHFSTDKNYIGDKILDVSSPETNFASMVNLLTIEHYQMLPTAVHQKTGEIPPCSPFHPHSFLCHPHPNINIHGAAGPWRSRVHWAREEMQEGWRGC